MPFTIVVLLLSLSLRSAASGARPAQGGPCNGPHFGDRYSAFCVADITELSGGTWLCLCALQALSPSVQPDCVIHMEKEGADVLGNLGVTARAAEDVETDLLAQVRFRPSR